jgi:zinc/manganese transport system substrate-binding protein
MYLRLLLALALIGGLRPGTLMAASGKLRVLTTIQPLYCWAQNVAGDAATVENLLPADVGPHDFQLRPKDRERIQAADVLFLNGLGLEDWLEKVIASTDRPARIVVRAADGLARTNLIFDLPQVQLGAGATHGHDHGAGANPHIWLDPQLAKHAVSNLVTALSQADARNAAQYAANGRRYCERLDQLDADLQSGLSRVLRREIITFHDAFPYFCNRYGLKLVGVIEEVPGASPSPRYLAALSKAIRDRGVKVVFTEPQFNPRLAQQLARDLGLSVAQLDVLETGALSASAYEDGMRRNLKALTSALR